MKKSTPLEMAVEALIRKAQACPVGVTRSQWELAAAIVESFGDYEPDWELEQYKQGFTDANKIHKNGQPHETINEHQFRQGRYGLDLSRQTGEVYEPHSLFKGAS